MRIIYMLGLAVLSVAAMAAQEKQERAGITNFTKVDAVIACGGATEVSALDGLEQDGFKTIINLRLATEQGANIDENRTKAQAIGLKYVHIPFSGSAPDPKAVDEFLATVADKANQPVYIHCAAAGRVGMMWMIKRALQDGWPVEKAAEEGRAIGPVNKVLEQFARDYISSHK